MTDIKKSIDDYFDRGIDRIIERRQEAPLAPVGLQRLTPADPGSQSALQRLLNASCFDDDLHEALRPVYSDRGLLLPRPFADGLASANAHLLAQNERLQGSGSRQSVALDRASRLLAQELELRALAQMYFSALHPA